MTAGTFPDNPFKPGFGTPPPPFLAGRDAEKDHLRTLTRQLRAKQQSSEAVLLHGPRGNGKTALIKWLENEAGGTVTLRRIKARSVSDPDAVVENLLGSHRDESREETIHGKLGGSAVGEAGRRVTRKQTVSLSLKDAMKQVARKSPC